MKDLFDHNIKLLSAVTLVALVFFLFIQSFSAIADIKIRAKAINPTNTITFRGSAEVNAVPNVAVFNVTIRESEKDVALAQQKMTEKSNKLLALLSEDGVEKKDIQTTNYSVFDRDVSILLHDLLIVYHFFLIFHQILMYVVLMLLCQATSWLHCNCQNNKL